LPTGLFCNIPRVLAEGVLQPKTPREKRGACMMPVGYSLYSLFEAYKESILHYRKNCKLFFAHIILFRLFCARQDGLSHPSRRTKPINWTKVVFHGMLCVFGGRLFPHSINKERSVFAENPAGKTKSGCLGAVPLRAGKLNEEGVGYGRKRKGGRAGNKTGFHH
jgi:hypothetical protein